MMQCDGDGAYGCTTTHRTHIAQNQDYVYILQIASTTTFTPSSAPFKCTHSTHTHKAHHSRLNFAKGLPYSKHPAMNELCISSVCVCVCGVALNPPQKPRHIVHRHQNTLWRERMSTSRPEYIVAERPQGRTQNILAYRRNKQHMSCPVVDCIYTRSKVQDTCSVQIESRRGTELG